ncbi:MAG: hypothetical protein R3F59_17995 [Myxococcota bacterium]
MARSGGLDPAPRRGGPDPLAASVVSLAKLIDTGLTTRAAALAARGAATRGPPARPAERIASVRHGRSWRLPAFQFTEHGELPGWAEVCRALPAEVSPVALASWLLLPHVDLPLGDDEAPTAPPRLAARRAAAGAGRGAGRRARVARDATRHPRQRMPGRVSQESEDARQRVLRRIERASKPNACPTGVRRSRTRDRGGASSAKLAAR